MNEWTAVAVALAIGLPALGGALGQGRIGAAAVESIGRNPAASGRVLPPMMIALALVESLVMFGMLIAWQLMGRLEA